MIVAAKDWYNKLRNSDCIRKKLGKVHMDKSTFIKTIKFTLGVVGAIYIAELLQLDYVFSAGIVAILSILETRKKTIEIAIKRLVASALGLSLASFIFWSIGFDLLGLTVFLAIYIPAVTYFNIQEGLITNIVLATHLLTYGQLDGHILLNEIVILTIGLVMGVIINLHMPNHEGAIKKQQEKIEFAMKQVLSSYAYELRNVCSLIYEEDDPLEILKKEIEVGHYLAYQLFENHLFEPNRHYLDYMEMRKSQLLILEAMKRHISGLILTQNVAIGVSQYTEEVAEKISTYNTGEQMLARLGDLLNDYRERELPQNRQAFEDRARLFLFLNELEQIIRIKIDFVRQYKEIYY